MSSKAKARNATEIRVRVDRALDRLAAEGYATLRAEACCNTCSVAMIPEGVGRYAYYHEQDIDPASSAGIGEIYLGWSGSAAEISEALAAEGLEVKKPRDGSTKVLARLPADLRAG